MAEQIMYSTEVILSVLLERLQLEMQQTFGTTVSWSYSQARGGESLEWQVKFNSRPNVKTADLVRILHRTIMSFVDPLDEPDAVLALREENLRRQRVVDRWRMDNKGNAVVEVPSALEETICRRSPQPVGDLKAIAQRIVYRDLAKDVCSICQQEFTLADREYGRVADEDIGVVHTYCNQLLSAGQLACCPGIPKFGGRDYALGRACDIKSCEASQSGEKVAEIINVIMLPMVLRQAVNAPYLDLPVKAAHYVGTLGKRFLFDVLDIAGDLSELGFSVRVQSLNELRVDEVVLKAFRDGGFGLSSRDIAVALHRLIVGKPYEFKYVGMGYTMRDIADEIRMKSAKRGKPES